MFWSKKNIEKKLQNLNNALVHSFSNVKQDTENIFQWLNYFYQKSIEQERTITHLQQELNHIPRSKEQLKLLLDTHYSFEPILKRIRDIDDKISELSRRHDQKIHEVSKRHEESLNELSRKHEEKIDEIRRIKGHPASSLIEIQDIKSKIQKLEQKKPSLKEKLIKRLTKNSKDYVKSIILSYIKKYEKISSLQLKEMVVEEQGLCSKSSFYRILEEIEALEDIGVIKKGKEKHYLFKITKES